jgi:predicted DNA-binding transcriptional regulator YafY
MCNTRIMDQAGKFNTKEMSLAVSALVAMGHSPEALLGQLAEATEAAAAEEALRTKGMSALQLLERLQAEVTAAEVKRPADADARALLLAHLQVRVYCKTACTIYY